MPAAPESRDAHSWVRGSCRLKRRFDRARRRHRILRAADRPPNDEDAGSVVPRLARRDNPLLIANRAAGWAQAGDDEEAFFPLLVHFADFLARANDAVEAGGLRQFGKPHHLVVRAAFDTGSLEVALVQAGQHRHSDNARVFPRSGLGILHHRPPAAGVDGDDRRFEHVDCLHCSSDGVRDVVQFEVEEDWQPDVRDLVDAVVPVRAEELEAELYAADMRLDLLGQRAGRVELRQVERQINRVGHGAGITLSVGETPGAGSVANVSPAGDAGGGAPAIAEARAALSNEAMRRSLFQRVARCSSHIGTRPSRNALTTSAGILVSRTRPSQIFTSTGFQLLIEKISNVMSSKTQTIVRPILIGRPLVLVWRCYGQAPRK